MYRWNPCVAKMLLGVEGDGPLATQEAEKAGVLREGAASSGECLTHKGLREGGLCTMRVFRPSGYG